jgi:hypothetical protein
MSHHEQPPAGGTADQNSPPEPPADQPERRFTAPSGFDAGSTQKIHTAPEPITEIISTNTEPLRRLRAATPRTIRAWGQTGVPRSGGRVSWGWVVAVVLVIAALVAVAVLGTVWLTRDDSATASQRNDHTVAGAPRLPGAVV